MAERQQSVLEGVVPFVEETPELGPLPNRYVVRENDGVRVLSCIEAPNISVRMARDLTVSASAAHKSEARSIFLDGAAQAEPFMDVKRKVYNLDHHEGCVRAFTLSTCEQAIVVVLKGLDLVEGDWTILANEPDLDTVLAIWILLNHKRLSEGDADVRDRLMPLVRMQGVIDAHGFELRELCGFPPHLRDETEAVIAALRREEVELKKAGEWQSTDVLEYTAGALRAIDEVLYTAPHFIDLQVIDELARVTIAENRMAIVCNADNGIYEVEEYLKKLHGERLGVLALQKQPGHYTLRLVDSFLPTTLDPIYERLNELEPNLEGDQRWGGSSEIGGSPRGVGTGLAARTIAKAVEWVFRPPPRPQRLLSVLGQLGLTLLALAIAVAIKLFWQGLPSRPDLRLLTAVDLESQAIYSLSLLVVAAVLLFMGGGLAPRRSQFGVRLPLGLGWLVVLPVALVAAMAGGAWGAQEAPIGWEPVAVVVGGAIAAELFFRGVIHGRLIAHYPIVQPGGAWRVSVPNAVSALLYMLAVVLTFGVAESLATRGAEDTTFLLPAAGALVLGLSCGLARERSGSVWAAVLVHAVSAAAVTLSAMVVA